MTIAVSYFNSDIISGSVHFVTLGKYVNVIVNLYSPILRNTIHGFHVHELPITQELLQYENCCDKLGGHFNPTNKTHGSNGKGHVGDLCNNIMFNSAGHCRFQYTDTVISLDKNSRSCILGRSLIIHDEQDDCGNYKEYPIGSRERKDSLVTGNAGERLTCANINLVEADF